MNYNVGTSAANGFAVVWESQEKQEALMFRRTKMTAAMSQELMDELTDFGRRDLSQLRMDDLESEMYELVDAVTRRAVQGVLEDQTRVLRHAGTARGVGGTSTTSHRKRKR